LLRSNKTIAVSALADYAADPAGYCERKGQPHSPKHIRRGDRAHHKLTANRFGTLVRWLFALGVFMYALWLLRGLWWSL